MARRVEKLQQLDPRELELQERELGEQLFRLRFQLVTGQAESLKRLREVRRDLARVKTLLREKELGIKHGK
jgi:large subunit ribosomal protein L29